MEDKNILNDDSTYLQGIINENNESSVREKEETDKNKNKSEETVSK